MSFGSIYIYIYILLWKVLYLVMLTFHYFVLFISSSSYFVNFGDEQAAEKQK